MLSDGCVLRGVELARLTTVECSVDCFRHIVRPANIGRLTLYNDAPLTDTSLALNRTLPFYNLTNLTLQYFSGDFDVLNKVATFAPSLRKLRLIEFSVRGVGTFNLLCDHGS